MNIKHKYGLQFNFACLYILSLLVYFLSFCIMWAYDPYYIMHIMHIMA